MALSSVSLHRGPELHSAMLGKRLTLGHTVTVTAESGALVEVQCEDGAVGWAPSDAIARISHADRTELPPLPTAPAARTELPPVPTPLAAHTELPPLPEPAARIELPPVPAAGREPLPTLPPLANPPRLPPHSNGSARVQPPEPLPLPDDSPPLARRESPFPPQATLALFGGAAIILATLVRWFRGGNHGNAFNIPVALLFHRATDRGPKAGYFLIGLGVLCLVAAFVRSKEWIAVLCGLASFAASVSFVLQVNKTTGRKFTAFVGPGAWILGIAGLVLMVSPLVSPRDPTAAPRRAASSVVLLIAALFMLIAFATTGAHN